jgi:Tfp pilus assembly protein PilN
MSKKIPKKDLNLYTALIGPKKKTVSTGIILSIVGASAAVLLIGSYVGLRIYAATKEADVTQLEMLTQDSVLQEKLAHANEVMEEVHVLQVSSGAYEEVYGEIIQTEGYCKNFSSDLVEQLLRCQDFTVSGHAQQIATITGLSYSGGVLQIAAESDDSRNVSYFVNQLKTLDLFTEISYSGYAQSGAGESYSYVVTATFQPHTYVLDEETGEVVEESEDSAAQTEETQSDEEGAVDAS